MKPSNLRRRSQVLVTSLLVVLSIVGIYFIDTQNRSAGANNPEQSEQQSSLIYKPAHSQIYKVGTEANFQDALKATNQRKKKQHTVRKKEIDEQVKIEQEKLAKQKAQEAAKKELEAKKTTNQNQAITETSTQATTTSTTNSASSNTTSSNTKSETKQNTQKNAQATPAPQAAPQPNPAQPAIGSNKIGINGVYKPYINYGAANTDQLQVGIDAGQIVAGITSFNGNDGQTTYFGGHNPGVMSFMANSIYNGAVVTITDANGTLFKYQMIDKVDVDMYGEGVLRSIGRSAIDVYMYGANTESILIQFCNTSNNLMSFWYGVKI